MNVTNSPGAYFHELMTEACGRLRVRIADDTQAYLINLLNQFLGACIDHEPLALMLKAALEAPPTVRRQELKRMGDTSLFISGFFPASLNERGIDVNYYVSMGSRAYGALSQAPHEIHAQTFNDFARRFPVFIDILGEMSERSLATSETGLLRLYDRYLRSGAQSPRLRVLLAEQGVLTPRGPTEKQ